MSVAAINVNIFFCVEFTRGQWQSSEVPQAQGTAGIRARDLPVLHRTNTVLCEQSALQSVPLTSATLREPHSWPGAPALMLMAGRWDRVKDEGLTWMFPLDIYSIYRKRPSFVITSLSITTAKSYLNGDGGCLYMKKMMSYILYIVYNI